MQCEARAAQGRCERDNDTIAIGAHGEKEFIAVNAYGGTYSQKVTSVAKGANVCATVDAGTSADRAGERGLVAAGHKAARKGLTSSNVYRQECDHGGVLRGAPSRLCSETETTASSCIRKDAFVLFSSRAFS